MRYPLLALSLLGLIACGGDDLKAEGEECVASSECDDGLTCDFGATPPVCRPQQTPIPDAAVVPPPDAPGPTIDADPNAPDAPPGTPDAPPPPPPDAPPPDGAAVDA